MANKPHGEMAIYFGDKRNTGEYDNGVWMDLLDIPYINKIDEAEYYDTVIRTLWLDSMGAVKAIRDKFPHVRLIGLSDHPLANIGKLPPDRVITYLNDLRYLDGIMTLTDEETQWYKTAFPSMPVVKTGLPFPFETYEERYGKLKYSEKKYVGLGVGAFDNDRNFISTINVFNKLKLHHPDLVGVFLSVPSNLIGYCTMLAEFSKDVYIQERTDMTDFYDTLSQCKFVISLTDRNSPGRIQGEGAFFGVPVIGSDRLELQNELFPDLSVKPFDTEDAFKLAMALLESPEKGKECVTVANKRLQEYNYENSKKKFNELVELTKGD